MTEDVMKLASEMTLDEKLQKVNKLILDIEDSKADLNRKMGERDSVMATLRTQLKCETLKEAKNRILALDQQVIRRNKKIDKAFDDLSRKYEI